MSVVSYKASEENYWFRVQVAGKVLVLTAEETRDLRRQLSEALGEVDGEEQTDLDERDERAGDPEVP